MEFGDLPIVGLVRVLVMAFLRGWRDCLGLETGEDVEVDIDSVEQYFEEDFQQDLLE